MDTEGRKMEMEDSRAGDPGTLTAGPPLDISGAVTHV